MRILLLSRYTRMGGSSRVRFYQYLPYLESQGFEIDVLPILDDAYLRGLYNGRRPDYFRIARACVKRLWYVLAKRGYDLILVQYELFPWVPALEEILLRNIRIPYVVDYDDAVFHTYDMATNPVARFLLEKKIDTVMRQAALVTVGNGYLAQRARKAGATNVEEIPSVIDFERYPAVGRRRGRAFTIGWIGTQVTAKYLNLVARPLAKLASEEKVDFVTIGPRQVEMPGVPGRAVQWAEDTEVESMHALHVGIMPVEDGPWERGKCGYKLIQYMACGLPVVASPVGVNSKIVEEGVNGFLARTDEDWLKAFRILLTDRPLAERIGLAGRDKVRRDYCLQGTAPRLVSALKQAVRG